MEKSIKYISMEFKKLEWLNPVLDHYEVEVAFNLQLTVHKTKNGKFKWFMGNLHDNIKTGVCSTLERAKKNCEDAFHGYVMFHLLNC